MLPSLPRLRKTPLVICLAALLPFMMPSLAVAQKGRRPAPTPKVVCIVADFRTLALQTHDPQARAAGARDWLSNHASACNDAQLFALSSNRAAWLGTADSPLLMGMIDGMIESREAGKAGKAYMPAPAAAMPRAESENIVTLAPPRIVPPSGAGTSGATVMPVLPITMPGAVVAPAAVAPLP